MIDPTVNYNFNGDQILSQNPSGQGTEFFVLGDMQFQPQWGETAFIDGVYYTVLESHEVHNAVSLTCEKRSDQTPLRARNLDHLPWRLTLEKEGFLTYVFNEEDRVTLEMGIYVVIGGSIHYLKGQWVQDEEWYLRTLPTPDVLPGPWDPAYSFRSANEYALNSDKTGFNIWVPKCPDFVHPKPGDLVQIDHAYYLVEHYDPLQQGMGMSKLTGCRWRLPLPTDHPAHDTTIYGLDVLRIMDKDPVSFGETVFTLHADGPSLGTFNKLRHNGDVYQILGQSGTKDWLRVWCRLIEEPDIIPGDPQVSVGVQHMVS